MTRLLCLCLLLVLPVPVFSEDVWQKAQDNARDSRMVVAFTHRFVQGWLFHADPKTGLIPRNLKNDFFWNARDSAADNYPFMVLTCAMTGHPVLFPIMEAMLQTERRLTCRLGSLPDDFLFETQSFRTREYDLDSLIFGAAEYAKDGLVPITEWMGSSPWMDRMEEMIHDIWKHAAIDSPVGKLPTRNVEVVGDLLQAMSRLAWITGKQEYQEWTFRLADQCLLHDNIARWPRLQLDDHGCEIIGGLSEACFLASQRDKDRWQRYRKPMYDILDCVLEYGRNPDGLLYSVINPASGAVINQEPTDNWGYNYIAFLTVAEIGNEDKYREPVRFALSHIDKYLDYPWEGGSADGYADSIEGAISLLNRIPDPKAVDWVDASMKVLLSKQKDDGIIEGWHGDGNSARTAWMWALWKTAGATFSPWREDLSAGAVLDETGTLHLSLACDWPWKGTLHVDRPRHQVNFHLPFDYPRLNQFPEWFVAGPDAFYQVAVNNEPPRRVAGKDLWAFPFSLKAKETALITISKEK